MDWVTCVVILVAGFSIAQCQKRVPGDLATEPKSPFAGPGGNLGDTICAYCLRRGWWDCVQRWCFFRRRPVFVPGFINPAANFLKNRRYMRKSAYRKPRYYFRRRTPYRVNPYSKNSYYRSFKKG